MWKVLLEERGYKVVLKTASKAPIYKGVATGDLDLSLEVWLPSGDAAYYQQYKDGWDKYGPWYQGARLGLVVPSYVSADSIPDLKMHADGFNKKIFGIEAGASITELSKQAIQLYGLSYKLLVSSTTGMLAQLKNSYASREPIVVTLWNPHWVWTRYDLTYLDDPKRAFGKADDIYFVTRKGFDEDYPKVIKWMNQWRLSKQELGNLMRAVRETENKTKGAQMWIKKNQDLVQSWFKDR